MVVDQLLKYGEFGIVLFDNFQVAERTRNLVGRGSVAWVQIPPYPPKAKHGSYVPSFVFARNASCLSAPRAKFAKQMARDVLRSDYLMQK